jgi:cytoskeletal protein RodZ
MMIDLDKIGKTLRVHREEAGISVEEVSNVLCLRKSLIQALEAGKSDLLPHEVYVRSYIKEYANFLKIYDKIQPDLVDKDAPDEIGADMHNQVDEEPITKPRRIAFTNLPRKALVYPAVILILVGFYVAEKMKKDSTSIPGSKIESTSSLTSKSQATPESTLASENQINSTFPEGKKLMISAKERTWISVVIDDVEKKEFMLNAQEMIILNAKDRFDLLIGNAGGVKLILDGKDTEFTGKSGEVKRIKLS